jgi:hypothetical protein
MGWALPSGNARPFLKYSNDSLPLIKHLKYVPYSKRIPRKFRSIIPRKLIIKMKHPFKKFFIGCGS